MTNDMWSLIVIQWHKIISTWGAHTSQLPIKWPINLSGARNVLPLTCQSVLYPNLQTATSGWGLTCLSPATAFPDSIFRKNFCFESEKLETDFGLSKSFVERVCGLSVLYSLQSLPAVFACSAVQSSAGAFLQFCMHIARQAEQPAR